MNRTLKLITILLLACTALFLSSCRSDGPSGVDITGLWSGSIVHYEGYNDDEVMVIEFYDNGKARMGDPFDNIIYDEALDVDFTWSLGDDYLKLTAFLSAYYSEFYYDLSSDGETLTLILLRRNFMNDSWDDLSCGDSVVLTRKTTDTFLDLMDESHYNSY